MTDRPEDLRGDSAVPVAPTGISWITDDRCD